MMNYCEFSNNQEIELLASGLYLPQSCLSFNLSPSLNLAFHSTSTSGIVWHPGQVDRDDRERLLGQRGVVVWLTGLSGSGKSTIAVAVEKRLIEAGRACYRLDGDNLRHGLNSDLGFSPEDRKENIRRVAEVAALFADAGLITLVSFISPYRDMRRFARERIGADRFIEVYVKASLDTCRQRDPKGLYRKADAGEIDQFTGVDAPYEVPEHPDLILDTETITVEGCVDRLMVLLTSWLGDLNNSGID